jgi:hypothetical protein
MNPQGGEGSNNQPPVANPAAAVDQSVGSPSASPSLASLEGVVAAAKEAAAIQTTEPGQAPAKTQFTNQFGSEPAEPVSEPAPDLMTAALEGLGTTPTPPVAENSTDVKLNPNINTVDDLLKGGQQITTDSVPPAEAVAPAEETPADKLKKQIAASVNAFLEEVTKEKTAA